jgi:DNA-3-methyladenine glycosylase II
VLAYLSRRSTPGLETVDDVSYRRRTLRGEVMVGAAPGGLLVSGDVAAVERVERMFDTQHDPAAAAAVLASCPLVGPRLAALPGMRVPGCWEPFEMVVRVIVGQQVSVKAAHTIMGRLAALAPDFQPSQLACADLSRVGMPSRRSNTLRAWAECAAGRASLDMPWPEFRGLLATLPGIGPWTLAYLAIRLGRDPDAFPASDLGLLRAAGVSSPRELERMSVRWRPFRAYAALYLWNVPLYPQPPAQASH